MWDTKKIKSALYWLALVGGIIALGIFARPADAYDLDSRQSYDEGEFEGSMGWYADPNRSPEYYIGFSEGRADDRHDELMDELRYDRMQREWEDD